MQQPSHARADAPSLAGDLHPSQALRDRLDRAGLEFLARFLREHTRRHPRSVDALAELGQVYTRLGHWEEGLAVDRQLVRLVPGNPTVHYNLACSLALLGHADEALDALETAARLGYDDPEHLVADEDLASLRGEPRFEELRRRLAAQHESAGS